MLKGVTGELNEFGKDKVNEFKQYFDSKSDKELAEIYFKQFKVGITGVSMQMFYLIALKQVLTERFGESPIEYNGQLLEL